MKKQNQMNRQTTNPAQKAVPSDHDIARLEKQLADLRAAREQAKKKVYLDIQGMVDEIPNALRVDQMIRLVGLLNAKLKPSRSRTRGSPVSDEVKKNLEEALKLNRYSLTELESLFGLSISYISRIKNEMGLTRPKNPRLDDPNTPPTGDTHPGILLELNRAQG